MPVKPDEVLEELRRRIYGGGRLRLDLLSKEELVAMASLINEGDVEIVEEACRPFVIRKLSS